MQLMDTQVAADQTREDHNFSAARVLKGTFLNNEVSSNRDIYMQLGSEGIRDKFGACC